jgi:solute carrier family 15 (peptide/histidine transporter), member 3/4
LTRRENLHPLPSLHCYDTTHTRAVNRVTSVSLSDWLDIKQPPTSPSYPTLSHLTPPFATMTDATVPKQKEYLIDDNRPSTLTSVASYIIVTEFCERLAYYGFAGSLVLFFQTKLDMSNEDSVNQFYLWNGFVYVTPLIGGYIADTYLGRYKTILSFSILYLLGLCLFVFGSIPGSINKGIIFTAMYLIALAAGGIKPNVSTMGADQFDVRYERDDKEASQFFSYFYWSINLGSLCAYSLVAYICQYGLPGLGGENWGFFVGYLIPTGMMAVGVAIFVYGSPRYKKNPPYGSMLTVALGIIYETLTLPKLTSSDRSSTSNTKESLLESSSTSKELLTLPPHPLDKASRLHGGSYSPYDVEGMKYMRKLLPFLAVMIPFWGIYGQTKTAFQIQGCQMNLYIGSFQLPVSAMNIFNNITILALVPLFDQVLYPFLKRKFNYHPNMLQKIGIGFSLATLAMVMAGLIELYRLQQAPDAGGYDDKDARDNISPCRSEDNYNPYKYQGWYAGEYTHFLSLPPSLRNTSRCCCCSRSCFLVPSLTLPPVLTHSSHRH